MYLIHFNLDFHFDILQLSIELSSMFKFLLQNSKLLYFIYTNIDALAFEIYGKQRWLYPFDINFNESKFTLTHVCQLLEQRWILNLNFLLVNLFQKVPKFHA